ncbi:peptide chain release factor 1 [Humisphaera borealis]|uniref:PCRF domain-containing protein n=1 Tax=Humisphaera borealis TaxID=2807512 RepID=A0A7M2X3M9_9BACT|nr:PCRF domain-containing protein [Humisphaera borealis]QOV92285.1 PCRF domain-containing protein [Humisphaera borealis]
MNDVSAEPTTLLRKLRETADRYEQIVDTLNDPATFSNSQKLVALTREKGSLEGVVGRYRDYLKVRDEVASLKEMSAGGDAEMAELAAAELPDAQAKVSQMLEALKDEFVAAEDKAVDSFFLEIRAGTGGDEAALFAGDLFEMYRKYSEQHRWRFDVSDFSTSERGGFKEVVVNIKGNGAYRHLRFEAGGHRVQRVPETETAGRIHTSLATVAVLPELPDVKIDINPKDVEEGGCRGGGPGGQNVNKVETGWRLLHKPSGLQFKMTEHKSQGQNKERAWALLRATLYEMERSKQHQHLTASRKAMMGSGDRSQRIRTYNFPQNRCTDHRLGGEGAGEKNFNLTAVVAGDMDPVIMALWELDKQQRLEEL